MKHILIVLTVGRTNEKIRSIIPELSKYYKLSLYNIGEMSEKTKWYGDIDPRIKFRKEMYQYFEEVIEGDGLNFHGDSVKNIHLKRGYDGIIYDDNRLMPELMIPTLYQQAKEYDIPVIGNSHGNRDFHQSEMEGLGRVYDYCFIKRLNTF